MGEIAVDVQGVSKRFRLQHEKYDSLKEKMIHARRKGYEEFWALRDISVQVREGETLGILGRNGSGKSTLLKCICGVLQPTTGQVVVRGKLAGLLELGAGFQQDLTGRENIYLNGSLLGLSKRYVDSVFDEIVDFSGLEDFIDNQVKFYSSGMYVRLGFAVAVTITPDVLVIDEVLAVGDERFQRKCLDRVKRLQKEGRTIILVTHSPDQVRSICDRAMVLSQGTVINASNPGEAVRVFRESLMEANEELTVTEVGEDRENPNDVIGGVEQRLALPEEGPEVLPMPSDKRPVRLIYTAHSYPGDSEHPFLRCGDPLTVGVGFVCREPIKNVVFTFEIRTDENDTVFRTDSDILGQSFDLPPGPGLVNFQVDSIPVLDGRFNYTVGIQSQGGVLFDLREPAGFFEVMNPGRETGLIHLSAHVDLLPPDPTAPTEADIAAQEAKAKAEAEAKEKAEARARARQRALASQGVGPAGSAEPAPGSEPHGLSTSDGPEAGSVTTGEGGQ